MNFETLLLFTLFVIESIILSFLLIIGLKSAPKTGFTNILKISILGNIFIIPFSLLISKLLGTAYFVIFLSFIILHILSFIYTYIFILLFEIGKGGGFGISG